MKQHFESKFSEHDFCISPVTTEGMRLAIDMFVFVERNEITQGCINRIVDNLNKLAEYNAKNRQE